MGGWSPHALVLATIQTAEGGMQNKNSTRNDLRMMHLPARNTFPVQILNALTSSPFWPMVTLSNPSRICPLTTLPTFARNASNLVLIDSSCSVKSISIAQKGDKFGSIVVFAISPHMPDQPFLREA